jgi:PAS domain S-box-containing protein
MNAPEILDVVEAPVVRPVLRVLIVEDSGVDARVLVNLLRGGGWQVEHRRVETGPALAEALATGNWDVILSDHNLPELSAPRALAILQESGKDIPFLIVSGGIEEGVAIEAMKAGAHDFLIKGALARLVPVVQRELREVGVRTARRNAELSLRESELRYRSVWENSTDAVLLMDLEGVIRFANPAVAMVFGRDPSAVVGKTLDVLQPPDDPAGTWWIVARRDGVRVLESFTIRSDGNWTPVEIAFNEMATGGQQWVVAFARDISVRLAQQAELARNREQFAVAREIQQRLFPQRSPSIAGMEIAGASQPAESAGGDYFDYLALPGGAIGLVVADVSGHGVGSALLMAEARAYLRLLSKDVGDPGLLLTAANRALADDLGGDRFITMVLVRIDPVSLRLSYASAGHPEGLVFGGEGGVKASLRRTGPPLGRRAEVLYLNGPDLTLEAGDTLLLVTDGIDEALDAAQTDCFGLERAREEIQRHAGLPAAEAVERLCRAVRRYTEPHAPADDLTVLMARIVSKATA